MNYLQQFQRCIHDGNSEKFISLWNEYCLSESVDFNEFKEILISLKKSPLEKVAGSCMEDALTLLPILDENKKFEILKLMIDLQTTNSQILRENALKILQQKYPEEENYNEKLRIVGLRSCGEFTHALAYFEILHHLKPKNMVYHASGWGTGQILDVSILQQRVSIEFEEVAEIKHLSFKQALRSLIPIEKDNFLAKRFLDPEKLEEEAKENPGEIIKQLLQALGPKTSKEIKEELYEWVIPENEWNKWWQLAKNKLKKDVHIHIPASINESFFIRKEKLSYESQLTKQLNKERNFDKICVIIFRFAKDHPEVIQNPEVQEIVKNKLDSINRKIISPSTEIQILLIYELFHLPTQQNVEEYMKNLEKIPATIASIKIESMKRQCLKIVLKTRSDWQKIYLDILCQNANNLLSDFLLDQLVKKGHSALVTEKIEQIQKSPLSCANFLIWYFPKILQSTDSSLPYFHSKHSLAETYLELLNQLEFAKGKQELAKKMLQFLTKNHYETIRLLFKKSSIPFAKEFILLVSKCSLFTDHDKEIIQSLAEVVHPSLSKETKKEDLSSIFWTTEASYKKQVDRIQEISTKEMREITAEIKKARAYGDLRENAEYKSATEKRAFLQKEMQSLSRQVNMARLITPDDVDTTQVGIGCIVTITDENNKEKVYTILGPWDADPDKGIISIQSRFAKTLLGLKLQEQFTFQDQSFTITSLKSFFDQ